MDQPIRWGGPWKGCIQSSSSHPDVRKATLTEVGNLMMTPGRLRDDPRWTELAQEMITAGRQALAAADDRDKDAVFEAGGDVYVVCANCHAAFAPALLPANYMPVE